MAGDDKAEVPILKLTYNLPVPRARSEVTRMTESEVDKPRCAQPISRVSFDITDVVRRNDRWRLPQPREYYRRRWW